FRFQPEAEWVLDEESGYYKTILQAGVTYSIQTDLVNYENFLQDFDLRNLSTYQEQKETFGLRKKSPASVKEAPAAVTKAPEKSKQEGAQIEEEPASIQDLVLDAGRKLILKEVYFDQSKADLRPESSVELERIKKIMQENPGMVILLEGHTDNQGDANLNFKLAEERI